jgi:hypothetical protein
LAKVQKVITILSIIWHQWFFQLSVNKFVVVGGSWWWHKTGWSLWINFRFLLGKV